MQVAQRTLLMILIVVTVMFLGFIITDNKKEMVEEQWERIQTEEFLGHIIRNRELSLTEYESYAEAIRSMDVSSEVSLEVYRKERDIQGKAYYYLMSEEEIWEQLVKESSISLESGSVINVEVYRNRKGKKKEYYASMPGKE